MTEHLRGAAKSAAPARKDTTARPAAPRGIAASGRIVTLFVGRGHGFIRLAGDRQVFFHRSDVREDNVFSDFAVGDGVTFELLEDNVSGPRALRVARRGTRR